MSDDFFGDLGKSISRVTQGAVGRTNVLIESTKLSAQISASQKEIEKILQDIGAQICREASDGSYTPSEAVAALIDSVRSHESVIDGYRQSLARLKGQKVCPACGELIPPEVAFCPRCGAPTPLTSPEKPVELPDVEMSPEVKAVVDAARAEVAEKGARDDVIVEDAVEVEDAVDLDVFLAKVNSAEIKPDEKPE